MLGILGAALAAFLLAAPAVAESISGPAHVTDGDTIRIGQQRVRLAYVDAPELRQTCGSQRCGEAARRALEAMTAGRTVECTRVDTDRYGRAVAVCGAGGVEINREMVRQGWAVDYRRYDKSCRYCAEEDRARAERRGIWATDFTAPEQWRREHR